MKRLVVSLFALLTIPMAPVALAQDESPSRLSDEPSVVRTDLDPGRTPPLIEWGDDLMGMGELNGGFVIPSGAVWQPALWIYGSMRTAFESIDAGETTKSAWVNRLDLVGNLRLTGTERIVFAFRPLDTDGVFTGQYYDGDQTEWISKTDSDPEVIYFEGDIGELLPGIDPTEQRGFDYGITVGRQPLFIQEGMLINDTLDAFGVVQANRPFPNTSNMRFTLLYAWGNVNRNDNKEDEAALLGGLFTEYDFFNATVNVDVAYVQGGDTEGNGWYAGISSAQRTRFINSAVRLLYSSSDVDDNSAVSTGGLLFVETSTTPKGSLNIAYLNGFYGFDHFSSAARAPGTGGALGRAGILFASVGMGRWGAPLGNRADNAYGAALGYQMFFDTIFRQVVIEVGGRKQTDGDQNAAYGAAIRVQQSFWSRFMAQGDIFAVHDDAAGDKSGGRIELMVKF
jgi:hypothetical protein